MARYSLTTVRMKDSNLSTKLKLDYTKEFYYSRGIEFPNSFYPPIASYDTFKAARTFTPTLLSLLVVVFALILLTVSLIVIRFRILNSIGNTD